MLRLFTAVPVPLEIAESLIVWRDDVAGANWRPAETLHVTLCFFGGVPEVDAADLDAALAGVRSAPFDLQAVGAGHFGGQDRLRALWAGLAASEALGHLAARCASAARRCGLPPEGRVYRPHITLAYLKGAQAPHVAAWVQAHNLLKSPSWPVSAFGLYSSWRSSQGSRYELEREYRLG